MLLFLIHCVLESQGLPEFSWKTLGRWEIARAESGSCQMTQWCGWTLCVSRNKEVDICATHLTTSWSLLLARWFLKTFSPLFLYFIILPEQYHSSCLGGINNSRNLSLHPPLHCLLVHSELYMVHRGLYNC